MRDLDYRRKTLEELIKGYADKDNQQLVVNEIYGRIKDTFDMLDRNPDEADQLYRLFVDPECNFKETEAAGEEKGRKSGWAATEVFGVTLKCDAHELKDELKEAAESTDLLIAKMKELQQLADPLFKETFKNLKI